MEIRDRETDGRTRAKYGKTGGEKNEYMFFPRTPIIPYKHKSNKIRLVYTTTREFHVILARQNVAFFQNCAWIMCLSRSKAFWSSGPAAALASNLLGFLACCNLTRCSGLKIWVSTAV